MKTTNTFRAILRSATILIVPAVLAGTNDMLDVSSIRMKLGSNEPDVRRQAVDSILAGKAEDKYALINADVMELLSRAVTDPDKSVRTSALQVVRAVANYSVAMNQMGTNSAEYKWAQRVSGGTAPVDIAGDTRMKSSLLMAMKDEDPEVRRVAVAVLTSAYPAEPDLEDALVTGYEHEPVDEVRHVIIRGLGSRGYSSARTMSLLTNALTHAKSDAERAMIDDTIRKVSSQERDLPKR